MSCASFSTQVLDIVMKDFTFETLGYFYNKGIELRKASLKNNGTWGQAISARLCFIAQMIVNIVAIPLSFLAGLFCLPFSFFEKRDGSVIEMLKVSFCAPILYLSMIPTNLIAAFAPHSLVWDSPGKEISDCL